MRFNFEHYGFDSSEGNQPLPKPNVSVKIKRRGAMTNEEIRGIVCNPLYVGIGPSRPQIAEEDWVRYAAQEILEHGAEQFLVNLIYALRNTINSQKF